MNRDIPISTYTMGQDTWTITETKLQTRKELTSTPNEDGFPIFSYNEIVEKSVVTSQPFVF